MSLSRERGQALVEFALIAPMIILFLFAIVDFGIAMDRRLTLQHGVREGARYAAVHTSTADIQQRTSDQSQGIIDPADVTVCYVDGDDANTTVGNPGDFAVVSATFTYDLFIIRPVIAGLFAGASAGSIDMTPSGAARLERTVSGAVACP